MRRPLPRRRFLLGVLGAPLVLQGCGGEAASVDQPPEIAYGRETCDRCGMIISEARFAAGLVPERGEVLLFDDTGEMIATVQEQGLASRRVWVHDYATEAWGDGTTASYIVSPTVMTPMGTGVATFLERPAAEAFAAANQGTVMAWAEMLERWTIPDRRS